MRRLIRLASAMAKRRHFDRDLARRLVHAMRKQTPWLIAAHAVDWEAAAFNHDRLNAAFDRMRRSQFTARSTRKPREIAPL